MQALSAAKIAVFAAVYLVWVAVGALVCYGVYAGQLPLILYALLAGALGRGLNEAVHLFYKRKRPAQENPDFKTLIPTPKNLSFPSGHASFLFGISFFLWPANPVLGAISAVVATVVGFARVYCGVHRPEDIAASAAVGLLAAGIIYWMV